MKTKVELRVTLPTKSSTRKTAVVDCILPKLNYTQGMGASRYTTLELDRDSLITVDEMDLALNQRGEKVSQIAGKPFTIQAEAEAYRGFYEDGTPYYYIKVFISKDVKRVYFFSPKQALNVSFCKYHFEFTDKLDTDEDIQNLQKEEKKEPKKQ